MFVRNFLDRLTIKPAVSWIQLRSFAISANNFNKSPNIDYSLVPKLNEEDLEEEFVRGSGPGGQSVNKTSNCVTLKHTPTGLLVKCHLHRMVHKNQVEARRLLIVKLDNFLNGENSVEQQEARLNAKKRTEHTRKRQKTEELKRKWKERENID